MNSPLFQKLQQLTQRICQNSTWRQKNCFNLIPSENTPSLLVKMAEIADPAGRYAEHRTLKGKEIYFYQGIDFIQEIEQELQNEMAKYLQAPKVELRPISGQMANEIVFKALTKFINRKKSSPFQRLKNVIHNDLNLGGHLSSQPMGALFNYVEMDPKTHQESVHPIPVRPENPYQADVEKLKELLLQTKPELIIFGKSMFLYPEPVQEIAQFVQKEKLPTLIMYDMAHVLGLCGAFQQPLQEGAHVLTGSTHKTFFGPQRGVIAAQLNEQHWKGLWSHIKSRAFPGSTSNHHLGTLLGLLIATYEMNTFKEEYQNQVQRNAKAFAKYLKEAGLNVEGNPNDGYTQTHQVLLRVSQWGPGQEIAKRLEENHILTNYQALPDDESFLHPSGIRLGVQEMTRFGMKEKDFQTLAHFFAEIIQQKKSIAQEVQKYRQKFLTMDYTLPPEENLKLAAQIFSSILPQQNLLPILAKNLLP